MILVDTSAWIAFFRGAEPLASRVDAAIDLDDAAICGPVMCELRRGFMTAAERKKVLPLLGACHALPPPAGLWEDAGDLGFSLRRKGVRVKTLDLLIAVCALHASVPILTADSDFEIMQRAGIPLALV
ncbi:MAG: PIN domain-containing protein [Myxococcota bacterium]|nr:PIN domain-containing protein [Myxococcota bacterium]